MPNPVTALFRILCETFWRAYFAEQRRAQTGEYVGEGEPGLAERIGDSIDRETGRGAYIGLCRHKRKPATCPECAEESGR
jgi:hypothetical protein